MVVLSSDGALAFAILSLKSDLLGNTGVELGQLLHAFPSVPIKVL